MQVVGHSANSVDLERFEFFHLIIAICVKEDIY